MVGACLRNYVDDVPVITHTKPSSVGVQQLQRNIRTTYVMLCVEGWLTRNSTKRNRALYCQGEDAMN